MARTIRTCSLALAALAAALPAPGYSAREVSPLGQYVRARVADVDGAVDVALQGYAGALTASPGNPQIAIRAFRQAVEAGDKALALRAARQLDQAQAAPPDAHILLLIDRMQRGDWRGATLSTNKIEEHGAFDFVVPVARAWIAFGERQADPIALLNVRNAGAITTSYAREHEALLLLALKRKVEGLTAVRALSLSLPRGSRLRLHAAAKLSALGAMDEAASLLQGDEAANLRAGDLIKAGRPVPGAVDRPAAGMAALLARVSADLLRDTSSPAALTFARLSEFAEPENDGNRLNIVQSFARLGQNAAALKALDDMGTDSLFRDYVPDLKMALLERAGNKDGALALARARLNQPGLAAADHARLGDLLGRMGRSAEAATAYRAALDMDKVLDAPKPAHWPLLLSYGNALDQSGQWDQAKHALELAAKVAPDQATVLNHLGYAMLERRDNLPEATRLIARASAMKPEDAAISDSLGLAYLLGGNAGKAIETLERAAANAPNEAVIGEHLGDAYWEAGRRIDARYAWIAALSQIEDSNEIQKARLTGKIDFGPSAAK